jgi:hypothetical protein
MSLLKTGVMKAKIIMQDYSSTATQEFLEKIGAGEHQKYPSFDLGDVDFEGITRCSSCNSQRVKIFNHVPARMISCHECGHDEWD